MFPVIVQTKSLALIHRIGELRYQVWLEEKATLGSLASRGRWVEHFDIDATHFIAIIDDSIVAASRITFHDNFGEVPDYEEYRDMNLDLPGPIASFNRLVVRRDFRGKGLSSLMDRVRLNEAFRHAVACTLANGVGTQRKGSLLKLGFQFRGLTPKQGEFMTSVPTDFHVMVHNMKERPESLGRDKVFHLPSSHEHSLKLTG